ncbi:MAG: N-acetylmuramoyl-L-alanine amidase [Syntrophobacterales bacterium]|nr:N-acetylmuramoyl-L-alanine amidase [Syntrophobacterales bacterium]
MQLTKTVLLILLSVLFIFPFTSAMAGTGHVVIIDPAHGGADRGVKLSRNLCEKDITLIIAKDLKKNLSKTKNVKIYLTRSADKKLSISERIKIARRSKADLFVSLHINAGFGKNSSGYEVYFPGFGKTPARKGDSNEILNDMVRNKYLNDSVRFAQIVMRNIEKVFSRQGRGLRNAPIPVLEGLAIPAVVIELGFATNIKDRKKLLSRKIQKSIATALSKSIKEYFSTEGQL